MWPTKSPEIMIWTNLNLKHLKMLPNNLSCSDQTCLRRIFEKCLSYVYIFPRKNVLLPSMVPPYPTLPPGTTIWTNFNLYYQRMIPHKSLLTIWFLKRRSLQILFCKILHTPPPKKKTKCPRHLPRGSWFEQICI